MEVGVEHFSLLILSIWDCQFISLNFLAVSCYACRAFFRRTCMTYNSSIMLKCRNGSNNCDLTQGKKCVPCRFYQCLKVGMNPMKIQGSRKKTVLKTKHNKTWERYEEFSCFIETILSVFPEC